MKWRIIRAVMMAGVGACLLSGGRPAGTTALREDLWPLLVKYSVTMNTRDLRGHMSCFASRVLWFNKKVSRKELEKTIATTFRRYEEISMTLSEPFNFYIVERGVKGTCLKTWSFCDWDTSTGFCGTVLAEFGFVMEDGRWKINSVQDLDVHWMEKKSSHCCPYE